MIRSDVLAVAITKRCNDVLERSVVSANFPALLALEKCIERGEQSRVVTEVTISSPSTPSTLVLSLSAFIAVLSAPSLVELVSGRVVGIEAVQAVRLVELVSSLDEPDVGIVLVSLLREVLLDILEVVSIQMMVVNTADELAVCIAKASILVVSRLVASNELCRLFTIEVCGCLNIAEVFAASTSRKRYLVAESNLCTGEVRIEDAVIIDRSELAELDLEVVVVALSPDTLEIDLRVLAVAMRAIIAVFSRSVEASRRAFTCQLLLTSAVGSRRNRS